MPAASTDVTLTFSDHAATNVSCRNVHVTVWYGIPELQHIAKVRARYRALVAEHEKVGYANLIIDGAGVRFSEAVRRDVAALTKEASGQLGTAHIIEIQGFAGITTRSFLSTVSLLSRNTTPEKVFDRIERVPPWWCGKLNAAGATAPRWTEAELLSVLEQAWASAPRH